MNTNNPYNWYMINTDLFYGRDSLASDITRRLVNGQSFGITGGRRMGKTTLLRKIEKNLCISSSSYIEGGLFIIPIYVETLSISITSSESIYQEIRNKINIQIKSVLDIDTGDIEIEFVSYLKLIFKLVTQFRLQIIVLFDEIEPIIRFEWGRSFFAAWRSILHNTPEVSQYISAAFAGASEMLEIARDIGSPLGNVLVWYELELFSQEDTAKLMKEPTNTQWDISSIEDIYNFTGGHPFLIQYAMYEIYNQDYKNTPEYHLPKIAKKFMSEQKNQFQNWWDKLSSHARSIYSKISQDKIIDRNKLVLMFGESSNRNLSILSHTGIVRIDWDNDQIMMAGELFNEWFKRFGIIEVTPSLADQVDQLLKSTERHMRKMLTTHIDKKYTLYWLENRISSTSPERWKEIIKRAKVAFGTKLTNEEILRNTDLGELFDIILLGTEWVDFSKAFLHLSRDAKKSKSRFEERKDHLVFVRNKLRHVNEEVLSANDLIKAQAFCAEILQAEI